MVSNLTNKHKSLEYRKKITPSEVYRRTEEALREAVLAREWRLVDAPPGAGKTTGIPELARDTEAPITYLASRKDLYNQMADKCEKENVAHQTIPSPHRNCPTFRGEEGDNWKRKVDRLYSSGVSGRCIHQERDLPCLPDCDYIQTWEEIDPDTPVLIGNPQHAYVEEVIEDRVVVVDEFPQDAFMTKFEEPGPIISRFLDDNPELGYTDYTDFLQNRGGDGLALCKLDGTVEFRASPETVLTANTVQAVDARGGLLTAGVGAMKDLGNGFESTRKYVYHEKVDCYVPVEHPWEGVILDDQVLVRDRDDDVVWMLSPPDLSPARGVVGLDGTPTMEMWDLVFGDIFERNSVLDREEWQSYITDALNLEIRVTNDSPKPYFNAGNVTPVKDSKIAFWIWLHEDEKPGLITSHRALQEYEGHNSGEIFDYVSDQMNFGSVRSSNEFEDKYLGYVSGSRHYGDEYVKRWTALMGYEVKGKSVGDDREYGNIGNQIRDHMRVETLQDVLRFGRGDSNPTTVYVNTSVLPEWVPKERIHGTTYSEGWREVMTYMLERDDEEMATVTEVAEEIGISNRHARQILNGFSEDGYLQKRKEDGFGTNGRNLYGCEH